MPLKPGGDKATIQQNIREMIASGKRSDVAVAAAYNNARRTGSGNVPKKGKA